MPVMEKRRARGRPPSFDRGEVVDRAMAVFWASGHEGASIPMLTGAMGISAQSLYAAFGSKDALYYETVARYRATIGAFADRALDDAPDAVDAIAALLRESAAMFSRDADTPGCMITTAPAGVIADSLVRFGRALRAEGIRKLADRLERGVRDGQLDRSLDRAAWAHYLSSVLQGMSVQARDGADLPTLLATAEITIGSLHRLRAAEAGESGC